MNRVKKVSRSDIQSQAPGFIAKPGPRKKPPVPKVTMKERDIQGLAENLCNSLGIRFFRLPDSLLGYLARCTVVWIRVFVGRYLAGLPDILLFKKNPAGDNICRMIEIKTEAGKLSQGQIKWHSGLNVHVCYGWDETEAAIMAFYDK
jgi:VRR-NUC domain